jgi:hypothetical protein
LFISRLVGTPAQSEDNRRSRFASACAMHLQFADLDGQPAIPKSLRLFVLSTL